MNWPNHEQSLVTATFKFIKLLQSFSCDKQNSMNVNCWLVHRVKLTASVTRVGIRVCFEYAEYPIDHFYMGTAKIGLSYKLLNIKSFDAYGHCILASCLWRLRLWFGKVQCVWTKVPMWLDLSCFVLHWKLLVSLLVALLKPKKDT